LLGSSAREPVATVNGSPVSLLEGDLNSYHAILPDLGANDIDVAGSQNLVLQNDSSSNNLHQLGSTGNVATTDLSGTFAQTSLESWLEIESAFNENQFPMPSLESAFDSHQAASHNLGASNVPVEGHGVQHDHDVSHIPFVFPETDDTTAIGRLGGTPAHFSPDPRWSGLSLKQSEGNQTSLYRTDPSTEDSDPLLFSGPSLD
jgi:hypothetical protein